MRIRNNNVEKLLTEWRVREESMPGEQSLDPLLKIVAFLERSAAHASLLPLALNSQEEAMKSRNIICTQVNSNKTKKRQLVDVSHKVDLEREYDLRNSKKSKNIDIASSFEARNKKAENAMEYLLPLDPIIVAPIHFNDHVIVANDLLPANLDPIIAAVIPLPLTQAALFPGGAGGLAGLPAAVAGLAAALRGLAAAVAALSGLPAAVAAIDAKITNERIRRSNRTIINVADNAPLNPLVKEVAGLGAGIPVGNGVVLLAPAVFAVGLASPNFPVDRNTANTLTHAEIHRLSVEYGETFGILPGDHLGARRIKLLNWARVGI